MKLNRTILILISALSFVAMSGSLYFSLVMGLYVCDLCWYQRICMYPIWFFTFNALLTKQYNIKTPIRGMSFIGLLIASYQIYLQSFSTPSPFCSFGKSCSEIQVQYFRFLTIPLMSLIVFTAIFVSTFFIKKEK